MKIRVVKRATVRVVKPHELKVGDYILYMNLKCKVLEINREKREVTIQVLDENDIQTRPFFLNYYVIEDCIEEEVDVNPECNYFEEGE